MAGAPVRSPPQTRSSEPDGLLATKLHVPRPQPGFVPRLRLVERSGEPPLRAGMTAYVSIDTRRSRSLASLLGGGPAVAANPRPLEGLKAE